MQALKASIISLAAAAFLAAASAVAQDATCEAAIKSDFPKSVISNGVVQAVIYLPDPEKGYYRSTRFDWSGVVPCLTYKGHSYFGVWFSRYDPMINDAITGPVEEFRSNDGLSSINYAEAKPGELFLKPGVGMLRKVDDSPYKFGFAYPIVDKGTWKVHATKDSVTLTQTLKSPTGYAYVYEKTLRLDKHDPVLILEHKLKNIGSKPIDSQVYDHDFYMIDGTPTGPGMAVHLGFTPKPDKPFEPRAKIDGNDIVYLEELGQHQSVYGWLTGYTSNPSEYDFVTENRTTGVGVEQTSTSPISLFNFWSIHTTICPEAYIHASAAPGETAKWNIRYRFFSK